MPNRLADSASPYLRLHAHQEIDWREWSEEAWAEARERDLPVFVSLGYHACHWCHVMREETFDDPMIAQKLNDGYVAIKVDREERPEVDAVYMNVTQALTGRGGWPNSVFCTPTGEPFFAGTYFPLQAHGGLPGFGEVLDALTQAWVTRRDEVVESGAQIAAQLRDQELPMVEGLDVCAVRQQVLDDVDPIHGGFGGAPKFPPHLLIDALLVSGDAGELDAASHALEAMARGGICDQLGGGFHRYTVDAAWVVPHFEKMLYDNALLLGAYTAGWRRTPDHEPWRRSFFADVVRRLVGWLEREMRLDSGAFAASLDADSADIRGMAHEGIYYAWTPELLDDALGPEDGDWASRIFHVTKQGTFEHGLSTLCFHGHPDAERLERVRAKLLAERQTRFAPARDDKVVASWNGLTIDALVRAAMVFGERSWLELARGAVEATWAMFDGITLARTQLGDVLGPDGTCEDYAALALGYARFAGATGERQWLDRAVTLVDRADALFRCDDGGWWDAAGDPALFRRSRDRADAATPSGTAVMVAATRLVGLLAERPDLIERADSGLRTTYATLAQWPRAAGWALQQAMISDEARRGLRPATIVVVTPDGDPCHALARAVWRMAPDGSAIVTLREGQQWGSLAEGRTVREDAPVAAIEVPVGPCHDGEEPPKAPVVLDVPGTVYVCRGTACFEPVSAVEGLKDVLWRRC